ncbi:MAG: Uncharacterized protein XD93_0720, partial [candidate division WS6 bacterium 34_10]
MTLEQFSTRISGDLPTYDTRFIWLLILLPILIISFIIILSSKKRFLILKIWYFLLLLLSTAIILSPLFIDSDFFNYFVVNDTYLLQIPLWCITLSGLGIALVDIITSKKNKKSKKQKNNSKNKDDKDSKAKKEDGDKSVKQEVEGDNDNQPSTLLRIFRIVNIVILSLSFIYILFLITVSLFAKPYIRLEGDAKEQISTVENIKLYTTVPIRKDELKINLSPNQDYTLNFDNFFFFNNLVTGFEIVPRQNFPADSKVVTY